MGKLTEAYRLMLAPKMPQDFNHHYAYLRPDAKLHARLRRQWKEVRKKLKTTRDDRV